MGDADVQEILREWLDTSAQHRIEIVAPGIQTLPAFLVPFSSRISLDSASAMTFFERDLTGY
jgi:hypothetical protein